MLADITYDKPRRFYFLLLSFIMSGAFIFFLFASFFQPHHTLCIFRNITGLPCPGCGVGRGIQSLLNFDIVGAILMNPFSIVVFISSVILFLWALTDIFSGQESLYLAWNKANTGVLKNKLFLVLLFSAILANWAWNIIKFT